MTPEKRFQRVDSANHGFKAANRVDFYGDSFKPHVFSPGDFLSRLWARFGPSHTVGHEGFSYQLVDLVSGLSFRAYIAGSGPAYATEDGGGRDVLAIFERWISETPPVDCEIRYETDRARVRSGARGGVPFDEIVPKSLIPPPW